MIKLPLSIYGQESPGWISLYKLVLIFLLLKIYRNVKKFLKNLLVNEFRTGMGGELLGMSKEIIFIFKT